jgi:hypothetical protein
VRQVTPELLAELGERWSRLWQLWPTPTASLTPRGYRQTAGAVEKHGEERVRSALEAALAERRTGLLDVIAGTPEPPHPWRFQTRWQTS